VSDKDTVQQEKVANVVEGIYKGPSSSICKKYRFKKGLFILMWCAVPGTQNSAQQLLQQSPWTDLAHAASASVTIGDIVVARFYKIVFLFSPLAL
jgi:hypothetical protein